MPDEDYGRPIASTLVRKRALRRGFNTITVFPGAATSILGCQDATYGQWIKRPWGYQVQPVEDRGENVRKFARTTSTILTIPKEVARGLCVTDGSILDWYVTCTRPGRYGIRAERRKSRRRTPLVTPAARQGYASSRPVAASPVRVEKCGKYRTYRTRMPIPCHLILGLGSPDHVRFVPGRAGYAVRPCGRGDAGARHVSNMHQSIGTSSYNLGLGKALGKRMFRDGRGVINWHVWSDGRGSWEVLARPGVRA